MLEPEKDPQDNQSGAGTGIIMIAGLLGLAIIFCWILPGLIK